MNVNNIIVLKMQKILTIANRQSFAASIRFFSNATSARERKKVLRELDNVEEAPELNFNNHEAAFRSKSTSELIRAYTILSACTSDAVVDNALTLMRQGERWLGSRLFGLLMQYSLYAQFVAGETGPSVIQTTQSLRQQGLNLMVAPALEADIGDNSNNKSSSEEESVQDRNCKELLRLSQLLGLDKVESSDKQLTPPCLQLKMTAIIPMDILIDTSKIILHIFNSSENYKEYIKFIEELALAIEYPDQSKKLNRMLNLNARESMELKRACSRLREIGLEAIKNNIRLLVDMEWTYVNPMCSALSLALMAIHNRQSPVVCSTVQCYLKKALRTLTREEQTARILGVCYGTKIVRGAYLERERQVAPHLTCSSYQETSSNYNTVMESSVQSALKTEEGRHFLIIATHNETAVQHATRFLAANDALRNPNVAFAQIYGMAEHISLPLVQHGFCVYKSVAFGSLSKVLPYLARRAAENRAIMRGARRERLLLKNEITRRLRAVLHI